MLHTRRKVAANVTATCRSDQSPHAGVLENLGENFCPCNRILLPQQVSQMQSDLIFFFLRLVAATKFCCGDKDFHKNSYFTRSDLSLRRVTCCGNYYSRLLTCREGVICRRNVYVAATCRLVRSDLYFNPLRS